MEEGREIRLFEFRPLHEPLGKIPAFIGIFPIIAAGFESATSSIRPEDFWLLIIGFNLFLAVFWALGLKMRQIEVWGRRGGVLGVILSPWSPGPPLLRGRKLLRWLIGLINWALILPLSVFGAGYLFGRLGDLMT
jgi:hypothetical protein